jgi:hypothetical protein
VLPLAIDQGSPDTSLEIATVAAGTILAIERLYLDLLGGNEAAKAEEDEWD